MGSLSSPQAGELRDAGHLFTAREGLSFPAAEEAVEATLSWEPDLSVGVWFTSGLGLPKNGRGRPYHKTKVREAIAGISLTLSNLTVIMK